jgi:hypothetical protein
LFRDVERSFPGFDHVASHTRPKRMCPDADSVHKSGMELSTPKRVEMACTQPPFGFVSY